MTALLATLALLTLAACGGEGDRPGGAGTATTAVPSDRDDAASVGGAAPDQGDTVERSSPVGDDAGGHGDGTGPAGGAGPTGEPGPGGGSPASGADRTTAPNGDAHTFVPPAGTYRYDTSGFVESGSGPTRRRSEPPPESVDEVTVTDRADGVEVRTRTTYGSDSSQELTVLVQAGEAHLTRLAYGSTTAGVTSEQAVTPQPPILVARFPYVVGDRWESAWQDPSLGIQGVGWGAVLRSETVTTGIGLLDTVVLELHQRLRGSVTGDLTFTVWLDPSTGVLARQVVVTEMHDATGSSRSEITRVLREVPS